MESRKMVLKNLLAGKERERKVTDIENGLVDTAGEEEGRKN